MALVSKPKHRARISHERLLSCVKYDPVSGTFSSLVPRGGVRNKDRLGHVDHGGYRTICVDGTKYLAHRLAWFYVHGKWPESEIDHRDLDKDNNRLSNLRVATASLNHLNTPQPRGSAAPYKGAHWNRFRGVWQSYIRVHGKSHFLGHFLTPEAAHEAYARAATKLAGEFARAS